MGNDNVYYPAPPEPEDKEAPLAKKVRLKRELVKQLQYLGR